LGRNPGTASASIVASGEGLEPSILSTKVKWYLFNSRRCL